MKANTKETLHTTSRSIGSIIIEGIKCIYRAICKLYNNKKLHYIILCIFIIIRFQRSIPSTPVAVNRTKIILETEGVSASHRNRTRRQIAFGRQQLCETRTQFVQPQAALNKQGNWMFVVNQGNEVTQLVKTEVCT